MHVQYLMDDKGKKTAVQVPLKEWEKLQKELKKLDAIELVASDDTDIPDWQKKEVRSRLKELKKNPSKAISLSTAQKKIKQLSK
jgi:hypothetical protein